jgi:hypothetical protein
MKTALSDFNGPREPHVRLEPHPTAPDVAEKKDEKTD